MTRLLSPVISASFCSVWASGLLSWANWVCITCENTLLSVKNPQTCTHTPRHRRMGAHTHTHTHAHTHTHTHTHTHRHNRAKSTCSCSAVNDVRALLAGFGWQSWSEGSAPSRVSPVPLRKAQSQRLSLTFQSFYCEMTQKQSSYEFDGPILVQHKSVSQNCTFVQTNC